MRLLDRIRPPKFPAEAVPALIAALGSHDREVRLLAIRRLADFKQNAQDAVPALIAMVREPIESDPASTGRWPKVSCHESRPSRRRMLWARSRRERMWPGRPSWP